MLRQNCLGKMFIRWNYAKTKFHYNPQHIDQVKPKSEGGGPSTPKAHPLDPPLVIAIYPIQKQLGYTKKRCVHETKSSWQPKELISGEAKK